MSFIQNIFTSVKNNIGSSKGVVGIDIGSSSIKVVELEERRGVITLVTYGEVQLGPYEEKQIGQSVTLGSKEEQEALVDVIRESVVKSRNAVFAMSLASSFVTNVDIEADEDANMASMVRIEARKVIPDSLNEMTLDWAEIELTEKEKKEGGTNHHNVLIAVIQNIALERLKILMQFAGFNNPPTEIECFSSIRGLYGSDEEDIAVLDIGATSTKIYIVHKGLLMRMYRIRVGGETATKEIAKTLGVDFKEAEEIKCIADKEERYFAEMKRAHDSNYDRPFRELNQVLREYENKTGYNVSSIYLAGGASLFPNMEARVKAAFNKDVVVANPFSKVAYPAFMEDTMKEIGPSFVVALGAAMRAFE